MAERLRFYCDCTSWPEKDVHAPGGLCDMIRDRLDVTRATFVSKVCHDDLREIERRLGYSHSNDGGLRMSKDWAMSYHRSKLHGKWVYYFSHSHIEYVFTEGGKP